MRVVRMRPGLVFKKEAAEGIRRLFAGPLFPSVLADPALINIVPDIEGLRSQVVHSYDVGEAFRLAIVNEGASGAFNLATEPVLDAGEIGRILTPSRASLLAIGARRRRSFVEAQAAARTPGWLDLARQVPIMDTSRARTVWAGRRNRRRDAARGHERFEDSERARPPPLSPKTGGPFWIRDTHRSGGRGLKAVVWHGKEDVRVDNVPDPIIQESTDAIVRITSTAICGSDLHLYAKLSPLMREGDIIGHEPMGIVEEVGADVEHIAPGDRVVVPFNVSCGHCFFCDQDLYSQCETTRDTGKLAESVNLLGRGKNVSLFGYTHVYGAIPGGQAEYLRVPQAHFGPIESSGRPTGRALPLPLGRASDLLAGRRLRRHTRGWNGGDLGSRSRWPDVCPHCDAPGSRTHHRDR